MRAILMTSAMLAAFPLLAPTAGALASLTATVFVLAPPCSLDIT